MSEPQMTFKYNRNCRKKDDFYCDINNIIALKKLKSIYNFILFLL